MTNIDDGIPAVEHDDVDEPLAVVRDNSEVDALLPLVIKLETSWTHGELIDAARWTPHLVQVERKWALHVLLSEGVPRYLAKRLVEAKAAGHLVHVVLPLESLYDEEVLRVLGALDAYVYVVVDGVVQNRRHFLAAVADLSVPVAPSLRKELGKGAWAIRTHGDSHQKGRRMEALLSFLLGQVADFGVFKRNFRTETGEIDIVVRIDNFSTRIWNSPGVPLIFVESKNTDEKIGSNVVALLIRRLQTSRGRARLAMLFSAGGFTSDARAEELRLSESQLCVAFFDQEAIEEMINAESLDDYLAEHVTEAMIR